LKQLPAKTEPKQQLIKSELEKEIENLAEEVISGKRTEINLNGRGLKKLTVSEISQL